MNAAQITHIFWKEYRTQRSIWLGMVALIVTVQSIIWFSMPENAQAPFITLAYIGAILSVFYALASASVLFAGEREEQTHNLLQMLPVSRASLFGGKLLWLSVSWLSVLICTTLLTILSYGGTLRNSEKFQELSWQFLSFASNFLLWGVLCSLCCRRIYSVLALASAAFVVTTSIVSHFPTWIYAIDFAVLAAIVVQGRRWLTADRLLPAPRLWERTGTYDLQKALGRPVVASPGSRMFRRELWLEWQNAKWIAAGLSIFLFYSAFLGPMGGVDVWFLFVPLLLGLMTFRGEHRQDQYRFQANRGVSPVAVWSAKHLVWGGMLLTGSLLVWLPMVAFFYSRFGGMEVQHFAGSLLVRPDFLPGYLHFSWYHTLAPTVTLALCWAFWMYAIGHACSVLFKRSITAVLLAMVFAVVCLLCTSVSLMFDVPRIIAMGLPAVCLMGFSLRRTAGVLSERIEPRDWRRVIGILTLLALVYASSWMMWRLEELTLPPLFAGIVALLPITGMMQYSLGAGFGLLMALFVALIAGRRYLDGGKVFLLWSLSHVGCSAVFASVMIAGSDIEPFPSAATPENTQVPSRDVLNHLDRYEQLEDVLRADIPRTTDENGSEIPLEIAFLEGQDVTAEQWAWLDEHQAQLDQLLEVLHQLETMEYDGYDDWKLANPVRLSSLRVEQNGNLSESWKYQEVLLKMQRDLLRDQLPSARSGLLNHFLHYHRGDLKRWLDHPGQTADVLQHAAQDYRTIQGEIFTLEQAVSLKYEHQMQLPEHVNRTANVSQQESTAANIIQASQLMLPWEVARSKAVFEKGAFHQLQVATDLKLGKMWSVYGEIASPQMQSSTNSYVKEFGVPLAWFPIYRQTTNESEPNRLWRLAATSVAFEESSFGELDRVLDRGEDQLITELSWLRQRRLFLLNLAFRAAELETGQRPQSLAELAELRTIDSVDSILKSGEELDGEVWNWEGNIYNRKEYRQWHHRLYFDPISDELFQMSTIDSWQR